MEVAHAGIAVQAGGLPPAFEQTNRLGDRVGIARGRAKSGQSADDLAEDYAAVASAPPAHGLARCRHTRSLAEAMQQIVVRKRKVGLARPLDLPKLTTGQKAGT